MALRCGVNSFSRAARTRLLHVKMILRPRKKNALTTILFTCATQGLVPGHINKTWLPKEFERHSLALVDVLGE